MTEHRTETKPNAFRPPSVEQIVADPIYADWVDALSRPLATELIREAVDATRGETEPSRTSLELQIRAHLHRWLERRQQMVINATGVLIHTNLGRAPFDVGFWSMLSERLSGYGTLEFDLEEGERGKRGLLAHRLLAELAGSEAGLVVNNCAAAVFLMLAALRGKSVIVSRGELVQIGGGFRIPDIMAQSGARMIEVGTTNKTNLRDYEHAIESDTAAILSVHRSNFQMTGFVESVSPRELRDLCNRRGLLLLEDLGSGSVNDLSQYGLPRERTMAEAILDAVDIVSVSGDKLLGGPQAGLIAGRKTVVAQLADHPLYRALRPDKMTLAVLEITLHAHLSGSAESVLPLYRLLAQKPEALALRADAIVNGIGNHGIEIRASEAVTGGGTLPGATIPSVALVLRPRSATAAMSALRKLTPPVVARLHQDEIWFDLKTVFPDQDNALASALRSAIEA
jgi:L-seryl-tRNA(Ser) seleniumtransferase